MESLFGELTPILVLALIAAFVQLIKTQLDLSGQIVVWLSFGVGLFFGALVLITEFFPETAVYVRSLVYLLLFGLAASGFYDLAKRKQDAEA